MIPDVTGDEIQRAIREFDEQYRNTADWRGWLGIANHIHAMPYRGDFYPPKLIVSLATGVPRESFSDGDEANRYLTARGFQVVSLESLGTLLQAWMQRYPRYTPGEGYGQEHALWPLMKRLEASLRESPSVSARDQLVVEASGGQGRLTKDPWIALYDRRETRSVQRGLYVVYLFRRDMSGVYLTLNQGVTDVQERHKAEGKKGRAAEVAAADELRHTSIRLRGEVAGLAAAGFALDDSIRLAPDGRGKQYEGSTIAHRFYAAGQMPSDEVLAADLAAVLAAYDTVLANKHGWNERAPMVAARQRAPRPKASASLEEVHRGFADALRAAGLHFGPLSGTRHDDFVRTFLASLATKRFVILTGLSGSGKTQIALKFGQWLGPGCHAVEPVRPDWTGPEALLGFENALAARGPDGHPVWHAPRPLRFMLNARAAPESARLLVLDEMNLAHVERYFADVLSGMESGEGCLPNLEVVDGRWVLAGGTDTVALPSNLFVVGTVNVDDTTYVFSPKVLDRANTIEFRVRADDLGADGGNIRPPVACAAGSPRLVNALLEVARSPAWHVDHAPDFLPGLGNHLRAIHEVLAKHGFEFGHRVYQEAARFAAVHRAMGGRGLEDALDLQVLQKLLPRLHGARRRLEPVLCQLGSYAFYAASRQDADQFDPEAAAGGDPALPLAFDKIRRMTNKVRTNQFASFAE